jgi:hypothetical protein
VSNLLTLHLFFAFVLPALFMLSYMHMSLEDADDGITYFRDDISNCWSLNLIL